MERELPVSVVAEDATVADGKKPLVGARGRGRGRGTRGGVRFAASTRDGDGRDQPYPLSPVHAAYCRARADRNLTPGPTVSYPDREGACMKKRWWISAIGVGLLAAGVVYAARGKEK